MNNRSGLFPGGAVAASTHDGGMLMEEKRNGKPEKLDAEDLDQVSGGAFWYDALNVMGSIQKKKGEMRSVSDEMTGDDGPVSESVDVVSKGVKEVKKRLDRFAKH